MRVKEVVDNRDIPYLVCRIYKVKNAEIEGFKRLGLGFGFKAG
jgi:hypothetical protein